MQNTAGTHFDRRKSGLSLIGDLSWGSHLCQFYRTKVDLLEVLVPYLRAGLENNELCVWVTDDPLDVEEANRVLREAVPHFAECLRKGQTEILSRDQWRTGNGNPGATIIAKLDEAIARGFDGVRLACHVLPEEMRGQDARDIADAVCRYNVLAVFAYPRDPFDAVGLMAVVKNHRLALVKNAGRWEVIESSEAQSLKEALRRSEETLHSVFANMSEGFAYHRIVLDAEGVPCDYVFHEVNAAFERLTGLKRQDILGRRATQVLPGIEKDPTDWIGVYGQVALTGKPVQFESYSQSLERWYSVSCFSPHKGFFAVTFSDITERKATEQAMQEAHERLQSQAEELQAQAEELQTQTEELNAQAEELRAANEELRNSEHALRLSEQRVRLKLDSILSPEGDLGHLELADILDIQAVQSLMDDFYQLAHIPMSIVDLKDRVLVSVGWQEICTGFHRVHPESRRHCFESDTQLTADIAPGECRLYKCKNNMWDIATPLMIAGHHVGYLFSGQFFFEDEPLDRELFRSQARRYGFDEERYLAALEAVPRLSRESADTGTAFLLKLAGILSRLSYSNIELARSLGERERLMDSLRQSRERLNRAQEIAHLGSWELELIHGELIWSDEVYRIFGLRPQEFEATYDAFLAAIHPDDRGAVDHAYSNSVRNGDPSYEIEHRIVRRGTGEIRWVYEKCQHVRDATGKIVRSLGMVLDITERREAEEALRESEAQLQAVVEHLDEGVVVADMEGRLLHWNRSALEMHGFASLEECRRRLPELAGVFELSTLDGVVLPVAQWPLARILRGEVLCDWEVRVRRIDNNEQRVFNYGGTLVRDAQGQPFMAVVTVGDITERKRAEAQREHHLDLHVRLVRATQDILDVADLPTILQRVADVSLELTHARLGVTGHGFANGRPQVQAVSRAADASPCGMEGGFTLVKGGVHMELLQGKESLRMTDEELHAHPAWWGLPQGHVPLRGLLGVHLVDTDGRPNGMIMVSDKADGDFTDEDEVVLRQLASITSLALRLIEARDEARQRAREAIAAGTASRENAERLRLALESGRMGRWEWDLQGDASFWDERTYELLGVATSKPAASKFLMALVDPRDRDSLQELLQRAAMSGGDFHTELRIVRPGGEPVWLTLCGKAILDDPDRGPRMFGVLYDITTRKQMEDQLRRLNDELEEEVQAQTEELRDTVDRLQEEMTRRVGVEGKLRRHSQMLEGFFQHTITPLAFLDDQFNFVRVNDAYAAADGKSPEYFPGKNHFALYPDEENRAIFEQVVRTRQSYRAYARPFHYADALHQGVTYWNWQLTPLLGERGEVQFLVLNLQDVTERQRAFSELEQRARQLQQLTLELSQAEDRERKRLAEILHDDLQQQLAAAKFHLGILGSRIKDNLSVRSMVAQLDQILKDAIDKSRNLSHELSPAVLYQSDLTETFEWLARQLQAKHGLTVYVDAAEPIHLHSEAMKTFLFRAAQEILFNVVKHARVKEARLRLRRVHGTLRLTIGDQGQGFDPQVLRKSAGFGLLSIRERIELLGGRMRVKSVTGQGSVFAIALPDSQVIAAPPRLGGRTPQPATVAPPSVAPASSPRLRVVLADDHKVMREGLAALLSEQPDMDVVGQAGNGREAVNLTYTLHPDVVIMDVAMPLMAGDEATRQIKLHVPRTRVIALSMFEEAGVAEIVRHAGAEKYLLKTAPFEELLAAIRGQTPS